jgi:hypothetical protein
MHDVLIFRKIWLGYILDTFFKNSSGRPGLNQELTYFHVQVHFSSHQTETSLSRCFEEKSFLAFFT